MSTTLRLPRRTPGRAPAAWTLARAISVDVGAPLSWVTDPIRRQMVVDLGTTTPELVAASCRLHIPHGIDYEIHPTPKEHTMSTEAQPDGASLIAAERRRQVEVEGYTAEHDGEQDPHELVMAALCYASPAWRRGDRPNSSAPVGWPWEDKWWKPTPGDRARELVKAGALIAAAIDRMPPAVSRG